MSRICARATADEVKDDIFCGPRNLAYRHQKAVETVTSFIALEQLLVPFRFLCVLGVSAVGVPVKESPAETPKTASA